MSIIRFTRNVALLLVLASFSTANAQSSGRQITDAEMQIKQLEWDCSHPDQDHKPDCSRLPILRRAREDTTYGSCWGCMHGCTREQNAVICGVNSRNEFEYLDIWNITGCAFIDARDQTELGERCRYLGLKIINQREHTPGAACGHRPDSDACIRVKYGGLADMPK